MQKNVRYVVLKFPFLTKPLKHNADMKSKSHNQVNIYKYE